MAAPVAVLVSANPNHLRYLVTGDVAGGTLLLLGAGGATPDLLTDSPQGPIHQIANVQDAGLGGIPAGAQTQAQARALLLSDGTPGGVYASGKTPKTVVLVTPRTGTAAWLIDANQSGGDPAISITNSAAVGTAYVDVIAVGAIGAW